MLWCTPMDGHAAEGHHAADVQAWVHTLATDPTARQRKASTARAASDAAGLSAARVIQAYQVLRYAVRRATSASTLPKTSSSPGRPPRRRPHSPTTRCASTPTPPETYGRWSTCWPTVGCATGNAPHFAAVMWTSPDADWSSHVRRPPSPNWGWWRRTPRRIKPARYRCPPSPWPGRQADQGSSRHRPGVRSP